MTDVKLQDEATFLSSVFCHPFADTCLARRSSKERRRDTRLRGRSRFGVAKARHLKPFLLKE